MILVDYSQCALANIFQFQADIIKNCRLGKPEESVNILRHTVLSTIKSYKKKYGPEYGDIIIACDGPNYWRKKAFQYYKGNRKYESDPNGLDWKFVFETLHKIREELEQYFPYKVLRIEGAEADDIIAVLSKWTQDNDLQAQGLFVEPQPVLILSSDGDFKQLHKFANIRQWNPMQKKFVKVDDPHAYLMQHIAKAGDDGIPSILSPDDFFVNKEQYGRAKPMSSKRLEKFIAVGRDACLNESETRNWDRNNLMVNFDMIPKDVEESIIHSYMTVQPKRDRMKLMNYLIANKCRLLLQEIEEF